MPNFCYTANKSSSRLPMASQKIFLISNILVHVALHIYQDLAILVRLIFAIDTGTLFCCRILAKWILNYKIRVPIPQLRGQIKFCGNLQLGLGVKSISLRKWELGCCMSQSARWDVRTESGSIHEQVVRAVESLRTSHCVSLIDWTCATESVTFWDWLHYLLFIYFY